ncbi:MAG: CvpA family protein [Clostridia bacterium]|nr:CvpA family protein [Clostridia bacterium]
MGTTETLPLIIDGIILLIFILSVVGGYKKGFVRMVLSVVALIVSVAAANQFSMPVATAVNDAFVHEAVVESVTEYVSSAAEKGAEDILAQIPEGVKEVAQENGISLDEIAANAADKEALEPKCEELVTKAEGVVILPALKLICFAALYFIFQAICSVIISFVNKVFRIPIVNGLNKTLGAICGGAKGAVAIALICLIIVSLQPLYSSIPFGQAVADTTLMNAIYDFTSGIIG